MSQKMPSSYDPTGGDSRASEAQLAYLEQRALNHFYDYVISQFEEQKAKSGLTKSLLGKRIGRGPDQITRTLSSPGNWTIATVARLLFGISEAEPILYSRPLNRSPGNRTVMDLLDEDDISSEPKTRVEWSTPQPVSSTNTSAFRYSPYLKSGIGT